MTAAPEDTGITCGSGAGAFDIYDTNILHQSATRFYNSAGNLTRRIIHDQYRGEWTNPTTGVAAPYTQTAVTIDELAVPGDFSTSIQTQIGEVIIRSGTGAPVLIATGRQVYSSDGELLSSAGRNAFVSAAEGDLTAFDAVCAALSQ